MKHRFLAALSCLSILCFGFISHSRSQAQEPARPSPSGPQFNYGGDAAEVPAQFIGNIPFLPVRVNQSRSSFFVLDSTANISSLDPHRAAELGTARAQNFLFSLTGVDIAFAVLPQQARPEFESQIGRVYEGTLGNDFFQHVVVEIDYSRLTLRL